MKEYSWKFNISADAQLVGEELERLEVEGEVTPKMVLDFAEQNPESEMHKCFEWDDSEAAKKYRMQQAQQVLCSISFKFKTSEEEPVQKQRIYLNIKNTSEGIKKFKNIKEVLKNDDEYQQLVDRAKEDFINCKAKYETLVQKEDLKNIVFEIYREI